MAPVPSPAPIRTKIGVLSVVEYPVMDLARGSPIETAASIDEYNRRSVGIPRRADPAGAPGAYERTKAEYEAILGKFGWRIADKDLVRAGKTVKKDVELRYAVANERGDDFVAIVTTGPEAFLVRKGAITTWEKNGSMWHGTAEPVFVGKDLVFAEVEKGSTIVVRREKTVAYRRTLPEDRFYFRVERLVSWKGHWTMELQGDVVVDGRSLKERGYSEVFDWMLVGDEPLFFFAKDGRVGVSHGGEELPLSYDEVLHGGCCEPAGYNPQATSWGVRFHARRGITWSYVELGNFGE